MIAPIISMKILFVGVVVYVTFYKVQTLCGCIADLNLAGAELLEELLAFELEAESGEGVACKALQAVCIQKPELRIRAGVGLQRHAGCAGGQCKIRVLVIDDLVIKAVAEAVIFDRNNEPVLRLCGFAAVDDGLCAGGDTVILRCEQSAGLRIADLEKCAVGIRADAVKAP